MPEVPNLHLIIHNIVSIVSLVTTLGVAVFSYMNGPRKTANITWALALLATAVFIASHVIGVNVSDPMLSRDILMFNLSTFWIGAFNIHAVLSIAGKEKEHRKIIVAGYIVAIVCTIFFAAFPNLFLLPSVPKMYFPAYYNPGILNWTRIAFLYGISVLYTFYVLYRAHKQATAQLERTQFLFIFISSATAFTISFLPNLLVYDVRFDPAIGMVGMVAFALPFLYGSVRYGFLNVRVIAQQAFFYAIAVGVIGGLITLLNYSNVWIHEAMPGFPLWSTALFSSVVVVTASVIIWRQLRQSDILKYEFITTATHKFRTPLTHVKWASENLEKMPLSDDQKEQVKFIEEANAKMVELTNVLMNISEAENAEYDYRIERTDMSALVQETFTGLGYQMKTKDLIISQDIQPGLFVMCDSSRIRFIVQTFIENAVHYTPEHGTVVLSLKPDEKSGEVVFSVKDSGIGIGKEDLPLLFSKFYRGAQARLADTEGMGIGLYVAKEIIGRHSGRLWAESEGQGKGSIFSFTLPAIQ